MRSNVLGIADNLEISLKFWTLTFAPFLWSGIIKESFQIVGKTDDEIDKWKSLRMGLQIVRAQNLRTHPGSPSGPGE